MDTKIVFMDSYGHLMDKAQKLTGALYRVTDLLSDKEPLKWLLRKKAVNIYNNLLIMKKNDIILDTIFNDLSCIIKNLELISIGTYISNLNFEILKKEYLNLKSLINGENLSDKSVSIGHSICHSIGHSIGHSDQVQVKNQAKDRPSLISKGISKGRSFANSNERKQKIIDFLKNQEPKTISEIMPIFEGRGEKSLQRDLSDLVQSGKIKAEGERRWRRYSLELSTI